MVTYTPENSMFGFLIGDTAAVIDDAEQHQSRRPAAFFDPQRRGHLL
jgi:hypothetical protein